MTISPAQFKMIALKTDIIRVEARIDSIDEKLSRLLTVVDNLAKEVRDVKEAFSFNQGAHNRFDYGITKIGRHLNINPYN
jgi:hypothetical protein